MNVPIAREIPSRALPVVGRHDRNPVTSRQSGNRAVQYSINVGVVVREDGREAVFRHRARVDGQMLDLASTCHVEHRLGTRVARVGFEIGPVVCQSIGGLMDPVSVGMSVVATIIAAVSYWKMKRIEQAKARAELRVEEMLHRAAAGELRDEWRAYEPLLERFFREQTELAPAVRKHADGMDANGSLVRQGIAEERRCPRLPAENYEAIGALLAEERDAAVRLAKYLRKGAAALRELFIGEDVRKEAPSADNRATGDGQSAANDAHADERVTPFRKRKSGCAAEPK
jgi:hypothetical protein